MDGFVVLCFLPVAGWQRVVGLCAWFYRADRHGPVDGTQCLLGDGLLATVPRLFAPGRPQANVYFFYAFAGVVDGDFGRSDVLNNDE